MRKTTCSALLCVALLLSACGARQLHPYELQEARVGAPGVETVGLLPLNVLVALPSELDAGRGRVEAEIRDHLEECSVRTQLFGIREARKLWSEVAGDGAETSDAQIGEYVRRLHARRPFDVLVAPNLVFRDARIQYSTQNAIWDGVKRPLEVVGHHHMSGSVYTDSKMMGEISAVSLYLVAFDPDGTRIFESYGGLDLVHEAKLGTEYHYDNNRHRYPVATVEFRLKNRRLDDEEELQEGVAMAFHPFLVSPAHPIEDAE